MRRVFLVVQTSIALALVATAAVTFKAGRAPHRVDPGFRTANLVLVDLKPAAWRYNDDMAARSYILEAMHRLRELAASGECGRRERPSRASTATESPTRSCPPIARAAAGRAPAGNCLLAGPGANETLGCPWCAGARSKRATARARRGSSS